MLQIAFVWAWLVFRKAVVQHLPSWSALAGLPSQMPLFGGLKRQMFTLTVLGTGSPAKLPTGLVSGEVSLSLSDWLPLSPHVLDDLSSVREKTKERRRVGGRERGRSYCSDVFSYKDCTMNLNLQNPEVTEDSTDIITCRQRIKWLPKAHIKWKF